MTQRQQLSEFENVFIVGDERKGPAYASYVLGKELLTDFEDILILASDDFYPPLNWAEYLKSVPFKGALLVNDGHQFGGCVTIPIMTYECLLRLNKIIYHPSYHWQFADAELYQNLYEMNLLLDIRTTSPVFEHRHWARGLRPIDAQDEPGARLRDYDIINYQYRSKLSLDARLIV
jgi:hypothetical protein